MARALYERHPSEPEGYLSRRYNVLVARETCADVGRELGIPKLVRLGKQAREDGATQSENVLGDVVEALIGALLLDGGLEAAERFIRDIWEPHLAEQRKAPQHPKSALQELAAEKGYKAPAYEVVARTGAHHAPKFTIRVSVPRLGEATAEGTSKQEAETAAAEALLSQLI
jgi:ribonuclease-3